ncbi:exported hypothetical protein [Candidatus Sulfotelmatomonas gaucii]|uniref:Thiol:disulfide interchange protein DsbD N-terminal domain-containing protein n=1 Tax=Candidatus Sulfuritelmatomonas gaucii TaxID=2043161 RepID=A0A2N9LWM8_9BACT|nr:exported hypothetical protein [Candidatus Sulfotelmatomonas gaucii]
MRRHQFIIGLMFFLGAGLPAVAASNSADAEHLHVELVIPHDQLYPGGTNRAGLYFKLEPGWHVYWQNAGDSGEPPRIHWTLPDGVTAAPLQFPAPTRLPLGPLMDYGYENEVLFPFSFQVADSAKQGPAALHAKVDWLVCREVCIPGKAELDENIQLLHAAPMPAAVSGPDQALWDRLANNLPQPLPAADTAVFQPIASSRLQAAFVSPSPQAGAKRKLNFFLKTRTFLATLRRKLSRPRRLDWFSNSRRIRTSRRVRRS